MKKIMALLLALMVLLSLAACKEKKPEQPTVTTTTAEPTDELDHYDLGDMDLEAIGELFAQKHSMQHLRADARSRGHCEPCFAENAG